MSDKPEDRDIIDNLFRDSIENVETEPSARFWNRAYENILKNENAGYQRRLNLWRGISVMLALAVTGLLGYNFYTHRKITGIEQQQVNNTDHYVSLAVNKLVNTGIAVAGQNNTPLNPSAQNAEKQVASSVPEIALARHPHKKVSSFSATYTHALARNNSENELYDRTSVTNIIYLDERTPDAIKLPSPAKTNPALDAVGVADSLYMVPIGPPAPSMHIIRPVSKISVYAYGGALIVHEKMKDNNPGDDITVSEIKSKERQTEGYVAGINLGYDLSRRFTLQAGFSYNVYKYSIAPTTVAVNTGELGAGYSFATTAGTVYMPYISGYSPWGYDTVATANGHILRSYINIPVKLKYNVIASRRFGFYLTAGASMNILAYNYASVHCQNLYGEEDVYIYNMEGANEINFSCLAGIGAEYKLGKGFALYAEPYYLGAITPNIRSKALTVYTSYYNVTGGISYHF